MTISVGERLPDAKLFELTDDGPTERSVDELFAGRTVALVGVPGAFTPTCHNRHLPSFVEKAAEFAGKGVDEIICVSVNDPFVLGAWGRASGATEVGVRLIADPAAELVGAMGLSFDASARGLMTRSRRFSSLVRDREIVSLNLEDAPGKAEATLAPVLLGQI